MAQQYVLRRSIRLLPALALILPTVISLYLTFSQNRLYGAGFVQFVRSSRASVQIIVQLASSLLSIAQLYCLSSLFNFATRLHIDHASTSLSQLGFWTALSNTNIDWTLPPKYLSVTFIVTLLSVVPNALWAGALTPEVMLGRNFTAQVLTPAYSARSNGTWNSEFQLRAYNNVWAVLDVCTTIHDRRGLIPSCPVPGLQSVLLSSAATATTVDGGVRVHSKLDNAQWSYIGRSYGVGSSAGLVLSSFEAESASSLIDTVNYVETGYATQVSCIRNSTSDLTLRNYGEFGPLPIQQFGLEGFLPNEWSELQPEIYPVPIHPSTYQTVAAWAARSWRRTYFIAIAAGGGSTSPIDKLQCEITFPPTLFQVVVNLTSQGITVIPLEASSSDLEPSGNLSSNVVESINLLSRMSPSLYQSVVGTALLNNVQNVQIRENTTSQGDDIVLEAVADSFIAILDDILVAYGASQLIISNDTTSVDAFGDAYGVRLGESQYIYAITVVNAVIGVILFVESARTRCWSRLSRFNYASLPSMVLAASSGGSAMAEALKQWRLLSGKGSWDGGGDPAFAEVKLRIRQLKIVPAGIAEDVVPSEASQTSQSSSTNSLKYNSVGFGKSGYLRLPDTIH